MGCVNINPDNKNIRTDLQGDNFIKRKKGFEKPNPFFMVLLI